MRLIKLIGPAAVISALAMFAPQVDAQTMGEYATTVGVASGDSSLGTSTDNSLSGGSLGGGSRTWGASSLGASFDERAGAASGSGTSQSFEARAGAGSGSESRWPTQSGLNNNETSKRFSSDAGADRWAQTDRFPSRDKLSSTSTNRFPPSAFNDNKMGLDTHYSSSSGLDTSYSSK